MLSLPILQTHLMLAICYSYSVLSYEIQKNVALTFQQNSYHLPLFLMCWECLSILYQHTWFRRANDRIAEPWRNRLGANVCTSQQLDSKYTERLSTIQQRLPSRNSRCYLWSWSRLSLQSLPAMLPFTNLQRRFQKRLRPAMEHLPKSRTADWPTHIYINNSPGA